MSILDLGLRFEGMSESQIKQIDAALPAFERLAAAWQQAAPIITPLLPIIQKSWPDILVVTPVLQQIVTFIKQKESET